MQIEILQAISGAKQAKGLTVIIDVFRAFSVEAHMWSRGVEKILPVGDAAIAYALKEQHPDWLLVGERGGRMLPGFDCGNSPSELLRLDLRGKTVVHTTSAGTQGIANAVGADEILGGSLLTAKAIAAYIRRSGAEQVSLVCMGTAGIHEAEEDTLCAEYIRSLLLGEPMDIQAKATALRDTAGAKFFDPQKPDFPEADFSLCTQPDCFDFVLRLTKGADGQAFMQGIPVES